MNNNCIIMSVPPPYSQRSCTPNTGAATGDQSREDCRDYLRTGRCKYGASCKYNHPSNVQSGGGMKMPIDPNEPMFPVRPNEPICQYYMKHGTCKFGQACKFHHPPQSQMAVLMATSAGGGGRKNDGGATQQILMNTVAAQDVNGAPVMLQFLPQRPDEQDCIFFLKNGRCKYGATCRYHHPINVAPQRRQEESRRPRQGQVQYVGQGGGTQLRYQQGSGSSGGGGHLVLTDGNVAYMPVEGSSGKTYQPVQVAMNNDGYVAPSGAPITLNPDHASSSSSIASSYDTANSNLDHLAAHGGEHAAGGLWHRPRSQNNLNAYTSDSGGRPQVVPLGARMGMPQSTSDGSIASRRHRAASYGSASDSSVYIDANGSLHSRPTGPGGSSTSLQSNSAGSMAARGGWRVERSPTDSSRRQIPTGSNQYQRRGGVDDEHVGTRSPGVARRGPPPPHGRRRGSHGVDDGLSMMTSALLTMMDTPEDAALEEYQFDGTPSAAALAAAMQARNGGGPKESGSPSGPKAHEGQRDAISPHNQRDTIAYVVQAHGDQLDRDMFGGMVMAPQVVIDPRYHHQDPHAHQYHQDPQVHHQYHEDPDQYEDQGQASDDNVSWFPHWQATNSVGRPMEGNAQSMSAMQTQHAPNSPHTTSNVGLFLP